MGCDIHCYVEYRMPGREDWIAFGGRINPGRDYDKFARLAGVRGNGALVKPRGMPADAAHEAVSDSRLYVVDRETDSEGEVSRTRAAQWVASGSSKYTGHDNKFVSHPDWHSHTYLTLAEWREAIAADPKDTYDVKYIALTAAMEAMAGIGCEPRIVFWFDN